MSLPVKLGVGALTLGSAVGAGYAGISYFSKEDKKEELNNTLQQGTAISKLISDRFDYVLLNTTEGDNNPDKKHWDTIWTNYQRDNGTGTDVFELDGWSNRGSNNLTEALKTKCKSLSTSTEESLYDNVTKYCSRGVTFEEQAKKDESTILETVKATHAKIWAQRHEAKGSTDAHLKNLEITSNNPNGDDIKTGCGKAKEKNKQIDNYENIYASYKLICTKQPTDTEA
ncbi:hypothetical protein A6V39_01270 [Candidatus Mycoplasma haematobovis]|uniref:Uncharacterized protein n=1 Tax=Candidatus Mycoplasma haematobovis TaxID=432608 RepID=A0A1A9QEX1_9MOLU|nr:hypothetical protein [Candidatus Mycoplasma haematobovis]OAL10684.1 hypothetical protein A6V39_01270 [Candidatus Mycoplasma haematobovis]